MAPAARAASAVLSSLPPSTTIVSQSTGSARSARSKRGSRAASFSAGITTEIKPFSSPRRRPRDPGGPARVPRPAGEGT